MEFLKQLIFPQMSLSQSGHLQPQTAPCRRISMGSTPAVPWPPSTTLYICTPRHRCEKPHTHTEPCLSPSHHSSCSTSIPSQGAGEGKKSGAPSRTLWSHRPTQDAEDKMQFPYHALTRQSSNNSKVQWFGAPATWRPRARTRPPALYSVRRPLHVTIPPPGRWSPFGVCGTIYLPSSQGRIFS